MSKYVLSTATCGQRFNKYVENNSPGSVNTVEFSVLVRGGANSASLTSGFGELNQTEGGAPLWTPSGVVTSVTDEEAAFLEGHEGFQAGVKAGFYKIITKDLSKNHEAVKKQVKSDMKPKDASAPLTTETLKANVKVTTKLKEE